MYMSIESDTKISAIFVQAQYFNGACQFGLCSFKFRSSSCLKRENLTVNDLQLENVASRHCTGSASSSLNEGKSEESG